MKVNGIEITAKTFAYEGCHKIYILESTKDKDEAIESGYKILPISDLEKVFESSCELRFINHWALNKTYVDQFEDANFE